MDYYKVMLVDDEEEVREAIKRRIDWESIGFAVVATAENGEDALEKAELYDPDVVMTDIQMPFMDGLTMLSKLKTMIPNIRSVIFSGYNEFEYAKEAIKLEAEEYILKPIDSQELTQVFIKLKDRLDEQVNIKRDIDKLRQYYNQSLPILRDQVLIGILEGRTAESDLDKYKSEYGLSFASNYYCVGVFAIDINKNTKSELSMSLAAISLQRIVDEQFSENVKGITLNYLDRVIVLGKLCDKEQYNDFVTFMDKACKVAGKILDVGVVAGIGRVYDSVESVKISYDEAKDATHYRMFIEKNQAICIGDVEPKVDAMDYVEEKQIRHLMREIKVGSKESIKDEIAQFIEKLKLRSISTGQLYLFYVEFLVELSRLERGHQVASDGTDLMDMNIKKEMEGFSSLDDFGDRILDLCLIAHDKISNERLGSTKKLAEDAKQYIADHYSESGLSVDDICSYLGVGASYFSSVFKKDTGLSFISYLTDFRMREAQRLLDTTDEKSYVIAGMVGYDEPNYFSYVFKKQFGVSPSKYRQKE